MNPVEARLAGCRPWALVFGEHKKAIPPKIRQQIAELRRSDNWRNLLHVGGDWLAMGLAAAAALSSGMHPVAYALAVVAVGSRQRALRSLVHEASHEKLFRNARLNNAVGQLLVAFPLMTSMTAYRCAHRQHHGHLWDPEHDPKMSKYAELGLISPPDGTRTHFVKKHILRPLLLAEVPSNLVSDLSWKAKPRAENASRYAVWLGVVAALSWLGWLDEFALLWLVPFCTTYQVFRYWSDMADHAGLYSADPWRSSRSWNGSWLVVQLIGPHGANWHFPHHLFPQVPHYRVRQAHELLLRVPEYAAGHHCDGFFWPRRSGVASVVQDVRRGERDSAGRVVPAPAPSAAISVH